MSATEGKSCLQQCLSKVKRSDTGEKSRDQWHEAIVAAMELPMFDRS